MKCANCGAPVEKGQKECRYCGATIVDDQITNVQAADAQNTGTNIPNVVVNINVPSDTGEKFQAESVPTVSPKSKGIAFLLALFLGFFGVHCFYVGRTVMGVIYLLTCGLFLIGWIYDIYRTATGNFKDANGLYIA